MPSAAPRIVSLVPSLTETCFDLDLSAHLVGRTDYCISPPGLVETIPSMGGPKNVDANAFDAARPTHVLISPEENSRNILPLIDACGAEAVLIHLLTPEDNRALLTRLGNLFDRRTKAEALVRRLDAALNDARICRETTASRTVLPLIWKDPWITVGQETYVAAMLGAVGLHVKPPHDGLYPRINDLTTAAQAVDWVLLTTEPYLFDETHVAQLKAELRTPHVFLVTGESVAWYGSRVIAAIADLIALKHRL